MSEAKAYLEVAERALLASDGALEKGIHEKAAFLGYHAFESVGGAFCRNRGVTFPMAHNAKVNKFVSEVRNEKYARKVAKLAIEYSSIRNAVLYPAVATTGLIREPKSVLSFPQAKRLISRTSALVREIKPGI